MDAHFRKYERKGRAMAVYFWHSDSLGGETMPCHLTWARLHHDWVKGEKGTWPSQKEAKAGSQGWQFPVPGCGCLGTYLVCMFGKGLSAGHHAGSPFIQLAQLLSPLVQGNARTSQVPNDPARGSSHAFDPAGSRDVLGEAARGFSCCGLTNCEGEMDRERDRDELLAWLCQCSLILSCGPAAASLEGHVAHVEALLCHRHMVQSCPPLSWSIEAAKELWNGRQGPSLPPLG